jgi:hypothetical protein
MELVPGQRLIAVNRLHLIFLGETRMGQTARAFARRVPWAATAAPRRISGTTQVRF